MQKTISVISAFVIIASLLSAASAAKEVTWNGLRITGSILKGGVSNFGENANYSLLLCVVNNTNRSTKISMCDLYNASIRLTFVNLTTGKYVKTLPGATGDTLPTRPEEGAWIEIGPFSHVNLAIALDGFEKFSPGRYKGTHQIFGDVVPEFEIKKSGDVECYNSSHPLPSRR